MVVVLAADLVEVQIHHGGVGDRVEEFLHHLRVEVADLRDCEDQVGGVVRPPGQIHGADDQRLVHGKDHAAEAFDPGLVAQDFADGRAEHDPHVLDGVVGIHVDVALTGHFQVKESVAGKAVQHVVKEAHTGLCMADAGAVQIQADSDVGLLRGARDLRDAVLTAGSIRRCLLCHIASIPPSLTDGTRNFRESILCGPFSPPLQLIKV